MEVFLSLDLAIVTMLLCALRNGYRDCQQLKDESGIDASPNSLKSQIEIYLGEPATRLLINDRIDMNSLNKFRNRLNEVLDLLCSAVIDRNCNLVTRVGPSISSILK
jgi:hypothetical protein